MKMIACLCRLSSQHDDGVIIACRCACQNHKMMMAVHHGTPMCMLKTHDGIMTMCLWNSQDYAMSMCRLSTSHDDSH